MILTDYHIHTELCGHAIGEMESYVEQAILRGLKEIGFSDHAPCRDGFDPAHRMKMVEFDNYITKIDKLRKSFTEISIKTGVEADIYPGFEESFLFLKESYPIDYVIGSVHFVNEYFLFEELLKPIETEEKEEIIKNYFRQLNSGLRSGLINIVGHIDVIKYNFTDMTDLIIRETRVLLENIAQMLPDVMIELNTSGYRRKTGEPFPSKTILHIASENEISVIVGSDAHKPEQVGLNFDFAENLLSDAGYGLCKTKGTDLYRYCKY